VRQWVVLRGCMLYIFDKPRGEEWAARMLPLHGCSVTPPRKEGKWFPFDVSHTRRRVHHFAAEEQTDARCWSRALELAVMHALEPDGGGAVQPIEDAPVCCHTMHEFIARDYFHATKRCAVCNIKLRGHSFFYKCKLCKLVVHTECLDFAPKTCVISSCAVDSTSVSPDAVWRLAADLSSSDPDVRRQAARRVSQLAMQRHEPGWEQQISICGCVRAIRKLLQEEALESQIAAAKAVQALALADSLKPEFIELGTHQLVIALLGVEPPLESVGARRALAGALWSLGHHASLPFTTDIIAAEGPLLLLRILLRDQDADVRINAAGALAEFCTGEGGNDAKLSVLNCGGLGIIEHVLTLDGPVTQLHREVTRLVANMATKPPPQVKAAFKEATFPAILGELRRRAADASLHKLIDVALRRLKG